MKNHLRLGPVIFRIGGKSLAPWGYPRVQIGGFAIWSRTNNGEVHLASYHPRSSLTWLWYVGITKRARGYSPIFSRDELNRRARLFVTGNPYVPMPRWWHLFVQFDAKRVGQRHDYIRLPFGRAIVIGQQDRMERR